MKNPHAMTRRDFLALAVLLVLLGGFPMVDAGEAAGRQERDARDVPLGSAGFVPSPQRPVGYRGDGSGVFPGAKPVASWNEGTGQNILWKAPLSNWGQGSPIVVRGRVLLMCEPGFKSAFPELLCFDASNGTKLWQKEVNHLSLRPKPEREQLESEWRDRLELARQCYRILHQYAVSGDKQVTSEAYAKLKVKFSEGGPFEFGMKHITLPPLPPAAKKAGLELVSYWGAGFALGLASTTPVSDGRHVWTLTSLGGVACFDLDGNQVWIAQIPRQGSEVAQSPVLSGGNIICAIGCQIFALDAQTGKQVWNTQGRRESDRQAGQMFTMKAGQVDVVLALGMALRSTDGKVLNPDLGQGFSSQRGKPAQLLAVDPAQQTLLIVSESGGKRSLVALRLALKDEALTASTIWSVTIRELWGLKTCCWNGQFYGVGHGQVDLNTGQVASEPKKGLFPATTRHLVIAGPYLIGLNAKQYGYDNTRLEADLPPLGCDIEFRLLDGSSVSKSRLSVPSSIQNPEKATQRIDQAAGLYWEFGRSAPFFQGDRIYLRSHDDLWCIGGPTGQAPTSGPATGNP